MIVSSHVIVYSTVSILSAQMRIDLATSNAGILDIVPVVNVEWFRHTIRILANLMPIETLPVSASS